MNPAQTAVEHIIRDLIGGNHDLPIRADFYRGISDTPINMWGDRICREYAETPDCPDEWFVRVMTTDLDVCVSAAGRSLFGVNDTIGEVTEVKLPQTSLGVVDVDALSRSSFHVELLAAIREKAAVVAEMRAASTT